MVLTAGIEALFQELPPEAGLDPHAARVRAASVCGLYGVEICGWRSKDLGQFERALRFTGLRLHTMCIDPLVPLTDPDCHEAFLGGVIESLRVAKRLGCKFLVTSSGNATPRLSHEEQLRTIATNLRAAAPLVESQDVTLLLENINSRVDHPGVLLDSTTECLDIVERVASTHVRMLYDLYHSLVMGERPEVVLAGRMALVAHVQVADVPGRHQPGTGDVEWEQELRQLQELGYRGPIGLEYVPEGDTSASLKHIGEVIERLRGTS